MIIKELYLHNYRGITNINVIFPEDTYSHSVIFLGDNGSGKTSIFESIIRIFGSFTTPRLVEEEKFGYKIKYIYSRREITIEHSESEYSISIYSFDDDREDFLRSLSFNGIRRLVHKLDYKIMPKRIVTFYSGYNDRFHEIYKKITSNYKDNVGRVLKQYLRMQYSGDYYDFSGNEFPHKQFIHCSDEMAAVYLCSIWADTDSIERRLVEKYCHIDEIFGVDIKLKQKNVKKKLPRIRNDNSVNELGDFLSKVIDFIDESMNVLQFRSDENDFVLGIEQYELPDNKLSVFEFLEKMITLFDAVVDVRIRKGGTELSFKSLSEGEMQFAKLIGVLGTAKEADCFVMMDEPDSHMNPKWKYELKQIVDSILSGAINTQALIATHDPMVVNGVPSKYVRIMQRTGNTLDVIQPTSETAGKGIDGILQSQYYNMESTVDIETRDKMERKRQLMIKLMDNTITPEEKTEYSDLRDEISALDYTTNIPTDEVYSEYLKVMHKLSISFRTVSLSEDQQRDRLESLTGIIEGIINNEAH